MAVVPPFLDVVRAFAWFAWFLSFTWLAREAEPPLGDDVALDLVGAPGDALGVDAEHHAGPGVAAPRAALRGGGGADHRRALLGEVPQEAGTVQLDQRRRHLRHRALAVFEAGRQ